MRQPLPRLPPGLGVEAVDVALDGKQSVHAGHRRERDRRYGVDGFALADIAGDVGQFEELPASPAPAQSADNRSWFAVLSVEVIVAAIGIGLQDAGPAVEMTVGMDLIPIGG